MTDIALDREALALFEALLQAAPENEDQWLADRAAGRADLLARVKALMAADRQASLRTGGATDGLVEGAPPERLGGYRIGDRIGAGGMGSVFRATRDRGDFEHLAAIKIIKPGLLSERLVDRFRRERQILARLRHPNIAQLFDGGETDDGSPFIIMEYVEGQPLLEWAEKSGASRADRIDKLLQACSAVSFAHANLIVHRDITPSNVLVTAGGAVKLIDFGIARPAAPLGEEPAPLEASSSSIQTLSLTPGYAAPERMTSAEPTTAADIYSLGKLSQKLFQAEATDRELVAIVAKATAHKPRDRFLSVDQLAADLAAWRDRQPVSVVSGSGYVLRKFVARHQRAAFAAAGALLLLVTAFAGTGLAWFRADRAREAEAQRFEDVRALAAYLLFDLNDQLRRTPGNTLARADLAQRAQSYLDTLSKVPGASRGVRMETALGYLRLAEIQDSPTSRNLGLADQAQANLQRARDVLATLGPEAATAPDVLAASARIDAMDALIVLLQVKDAARARSLQDRALASIISVPEDLRNADWHLARRDVSRSELEFLSNNEQMAELKTAADQHDVLIAAWPADIAAEMVELERAVAEYYRGISFTYTDNDAGAYPVLRAAYDAFLKAERTRQGDPDILYFAGWAGSEGYSAAARLGKEMEAEDILVGAVEAAKRLVAIEDRDHSAKTLNVAVGEVYAQHLSNTGRHPAAIAEQQRIVEAKRAAKAEPDADTAWSEMILGLIAKKAGERSLACESWTLANDHFTPVEQAGRLVAFHAAFLPGLRTNVGLCKEGAPISDFVPLR